MMALCGHHTGMGQVLSGGIRLAFLAHTLEAVEATRYYSS